MNITFDKNRPALQAGFTLVEVLIAVAILASLSALIASSWSGNVRRYQKAKIKEEAVQLLQRKMLEVEARYREDVPSLPVEQVQNGTFEEDRYKDYRWEWEAKRIELPDLTSLVDTDGQDQILVAVMSQFRDYLVASIKEVKVTITYQKGTNTPPLNFEVATYFVDYNQNISTGFGVGPTGGAGGGLGSGSQGGDGGFNQGGDGF